jgi:hypothetical protein
MRKAAICAIVIFGSWVAPLAQAPVHEWKVVQVVQLTKETSEIPTTTIFTPTEVGLYRVNILMACGGAKGHGGANSPSWQLAFYYGANSNHFEVGCGGGSNGGSVPYLISPSAGTPATYAVAGVLSPPFSYDVDIIIEQFQ